MIQLGQQAKDKVTGAKGIVTARATYLTGCDQYLIQPVASKDGAFVNGTWFDEGRIEIIGRGILAKEVKSKRNGGPACDAPLK